jgi:hypothetical protein
MRDFRFKAYALTLFGCGVLIALAYFLEAFVPAPSKGLVVAYSKSW